MDSSGFDATALSGMQHILRLMETHGVACSLREFQDAVNLTYHKHESRVYDRVHAEMWNSLPQVFEKLAAAADDPLRNRSSLKLLDIGCGTGLSSTLLLQTPLGRRISAITLADTSPEMIALAENRLRDFKGEVSTHLGQLDTLDSGGFDLALTSSVLHHIPDLARFFRDVTERVNSGGIYFHLQDPNGDYLSDPELLARQKALHDALADPPGKKSFLQRVVKKLKRMNSGYDYVGQINADLLSGGIIATPLTDDEMWMVTDIHVENGQGISLREMHQLMPAFRLLFSLSYSFFGRMWSELPDKFRLEEERLYNAGAPNGWNVAGVWLKR